MNNLFGIDLGTTYSRIAKINDDGSVKVLCNPFDGSDSLASAVYFKNENNVIIGKRAKISSSEMDPRNLVQFAKRYIGKPNAPKWEIFGNEFNPTDISALILCGLKQIAEEQGEIVENVVITVPASFGISEREATRKAGELAGLNVLSLINESTAAALSYCARQFQEERTVLVYNLGGETFDVSVVKVSLVTDDNGNESQNVKVIATRGNDSLGIKDWDERLFNYIMNICEDEVEKSIAIDDIDIDIESRAFIRNRVERTKKVLTNDFRIRLTNSFDDEPLFSEFSREEIEKIRKDLVDKTMVYIENLLASVGNLEIDTVLLVGRVSNMPMIKKALETRFPGIVQIEDSDRTVAEGAAIATNIITNESESSKTPEPIHNLIKSKDVKDKIVMPRPLEPQNYFEDIAPSSFGFGIINSDNRYVVDNLIKVGDKMGEGASRTYYTPVDNMKKISLKVFENMSLADYVTTSIDVYGDEQHTDSNDQVKLLGDFELELPPRTPAGTAILVTMKNKTNGLLVEVIVDETFRSTRRPNKRNLKFINYNTLSSFIPKINISF